MKRRYRVSRFLERMEQLREMLGNDPALTTDVIVGFPGETEDEFEETLETCRQAQFMKVHVFPFSRRDGTPAADFSGQVNGNIIKDRVRRLGELERDLALEFYKTRIASGAESVVLAERLSENRTGYVRGTDQWYMPVEFPGNETDLGHFVRCQAVTATRQGVTATRETAE